jgi:hypothetical protein
LEDCIRYAPDLSILANPAAAFDGTSRHIEGIQSGDHGRSQNQLGTGEGGRLHIVRFLFAVGYALNLAHLSGAPDQNIAFMNA